MVYENQWYLSSSGPVGVVRISRHVGRRLVCIRAVALGRRAATGTRAVELRAVTEKLPS